MLMKGYKLFGEAMDIIAVETVLNLLNAKINVAPPVEEGEEGTEENKETAEKKNIKKEDKK